MQKWYSATQVAEILSMAVATAIGLIEDGELEAVNIARKSSKRRRWRISESMLADFQEKRAHKPTPAPETKSSRRTIQRPTKDYFTNVGGGK